MNGQSATGRRGFAASALATAAEWLVEPAEAVGEPVRREPWDRMAVAVVGLGPRAGTTTLARALGAELAVRDTASASVVTAAAGSVLPLATPAAGRLARALVGVGHARACGRLCLIDASDRVDLTGAALRLAPLVFDVSEPSEAVTIASLAHRVVLVGGPRVQPALAGAMAASLERVGPAPLVAVSRPRDDSGWEGRADVEVPHSRLGAQRALAGREPRGSLGDAVATLADLLERVT